MKNISTYSKLIEPSHADGLVMLTWSNWFTELRSNRYHYASRFSKLLPVLFIQPDLEFDNYLFEKTELPNVTVIHVSNRYDERQTACLNKVLLEANIIRPIFWVYNINFHAFLSQRYSALNIYHGTEDYLASDSHLKFKDQKLVDMFNRTLEACDLLVSVSDGVAESFKQHSTFQGKMATVTNGCDYYFYAPKYKLLSTEEKQNKNIVFYQGNIFDKLDYDLLIELAKRMPSWTFTFCGKILFNEKSWQVLCKLPNVTYLGLLSAEGIREAAYHATVGIIPFVENEWLIERSFPLKAFEYLASGLPVVSVPIKALLQYAEVMIFVSGVDQFQEAIEQAKSFRSSTQHTKQRLSLAASQDYDLKFKQVNTVICDLLQKKTIEHSKTRLNIVILYHPAQMGLIESRDYLLNLMQQSRHDISFVSMSDGVKSDLMLAQFDVLIIYESGSERASNKLTSIPPYYIEKINKFGGYKTLLLDGDHDFESMGELICEAGLHAVHTGSNIMMQDFPHVTFMTVPDNNLMISSKEICFDDYLSQNVRGNKIGNRAAYVYSLVAIKQSNSFHVKFDPDDFLTTPSKNIFTEDDFSKTRVVTPRQAKKLIYESKVKVKLGLIICVKKLYRRLPLRQQISKLIPHYIKNKMVIMR